MSYLELRRVSKSYGAGATEVHALSEVDFAVERGSFVAVMGPSGSGKSTLLTIAGSLEEPTSGEVVINGDALSSMSRNDKARLRRRTVGYVFQDFNLLAGLTAAENVSLPLELDGLSAKKAHLAAMTALEELGLADRGNSLPRRALRWRTSAGRDRAGDRGRPVPVARRRAVGRARLIERRGRDAHDPCCLPPRRRCGRCDPRRAARVVGGSRRLHPGRLDRGSDGSAANSRVVGRGPPRTGPPPIARSVSTLTDEQDP